MIRLARICSDGCILQRQRRVRLWGWCNENASIRAALTDAGKLIAEAEAEVTAEVTGVQEMPEAEGEPGDAAGRFDLYFPAMEAGGPYELTVTASSSASESAGSRASQNAGSSASQSAESLTVHDIYIGEVIHLAGQSNIEFPMARVRDTYPEEFENPDDPLIRTFKVQPKLVFTDPLTDAETGEWTAVTKASLPDYSALGYFLAKKIRSADGVPVGLVNTSLGGSFVESWMSREMLAQ